MIRVCEGPTQSLLRICTDVSSAPNRHLVVCREFDQQAREHAGYRAEYSLTEEFGLFVVIRMDRDVRRLALTECEGTAGDRVIGDPTLEITGQRIRMASPRVGPRIP